MHRLRNRGNLSILLDSAGGNLLSDRLWTYPWDTDGARERLDGDAEGVARRAEEAGAAWEVIHLFPKMHFQ